MLMTIIWIVACVIVAGILAYHYANRYLWALGMALMGGLITVFGHFSMTTIYVLWAIYIVVFTLILVTPLRRHLLSKPIYKIFKKVMPKMSATEREALESGMVGFEGQLFSGRPDWDKLQKLPPVSLTEEEQAFLDGPVEKICSMINRWVNFERRRMPAEVWFFLRENKFFGMIIPKEFGGLEFSPYAVYRVVSKFSCASPSIAVVASVPNSLGPGELLMKYGTSEQKTYYLPRLANGEEIPCFALTSPQAGSDAGAIEDYGIVCRAKYKGEEQLCIRLSFSKRYISLAPIATLIGLAFKLYDPEHLLGDKEEYGITCALIAKDTPGISIGRYHMPLLAVFPNGPIQGKDVVIPIDNIIGGRKQAGHGWRMLMECLAAGRGISIPSISMGSILVAVLGTASYARIRRQFNVYIGEFGGIQERLARMTCRAYIAEAVGSFTAANLSRGEKSAIAAAITKYYIAEFARQGGLDAADILGGKAICMGPNNFTAIQFNEMQIAITVEGANILTRSMMIFGQGAIRCHPYLLKEMLAVQDTNQKRGLKTFGRLLFNHLGFIISSKVRAFVTGITNGRFVKAPKGPLRHYYQEFTRFSTALAFATDMAVLTLGGTLKRREELSALLGDILSMLYLGAAVLKFHEEGFEGKVVSEELPVVQWCCRYLCYKMEIALDEFIHNLPNRLIANSIRLVTTPWGRKFRYPKASLSKQICDLVLAPSTFRRRLMSYTYNDAEHSIIGKMDYVMRRVIEIEPLEAKLIKAKRKGQIKAKTFAELVHAGIQANIINQQQADTLREVDALRMGIINVDDFSPEEYLRQPKKSLKKILTGKES